MACLTVSLLLTLFLIDLLFCSSLALIPNNANYKSLFIFLSKFTLEKILDSISKSTSDLASLRAIVWFRGLKFAAVDLIGQLILQNLDIAVVIAFAVDFFTSQFSSCFGLLI